MNLPHQQHPSPFALDVHFADGQPATSSLATHLADCDVCRRYIAEVAAAAEPFERREPMASHRAETARADASWKRWTPFLGLAVATCGALLAVRGFSERPHEDLSAYVGVKGTPAVETIVRRNEGLAIWDGRTPLRRDDVLAFRLACEGYGHVAVFARSTATAVSRVYAGDCPQRPAPLPFSLVVDEQPGREAVTLVLSKRLLEDDALATAAQQRTRDSEIWVVALSFPKGGLP
jgi:hypothetical protein